jgi:uncharacterized protein (TIGR02265 family)
MRCTKGTNVVSVRRLLQAAGREAEAVTQLDPADAETYRSTLAVAWVPIEFIARLFAAAAPVLFPGEPRAIRELGRTIARDNLTGIYRMLLRIVSIPFAIERASSLWSTYNDSGDASITRVGEDRARMTVANYAAFPEATVEETAGYIEGVALLCGAKSIDVQTSRPTSDSFVFDVTWRT